jgi:hypothetical protein
MQPRQVLPNQFYLVTRRCTQRQFLVRPDAATNNAFTYGLIEAAQRCAIDVVLPCAMSNHYHAVIYDRLGRYPEFIEHFRKLYLASRPWLFYHLFSEILPSSHRPIRRLTRVIYPSILPHRVDAGALAHLNDLPATCG